MVHAERLLVLSWRLYRPCVMLYNGEGLEVMMLHRH